MQIYHQTKNFLPKNNQILLIVNERAAIENKNEAFPPLKEQLFFSSNKQNIKTNKFLPLMSVGISFVERKLTFFIQ